ncbi:hypothetical protein JAAARDRAFT_69819 [Jaapia argillacea MUCL 33604]|uniref:Uncharacterized protein n=1 Tax=Jaapia argillacea MUCL 33604 TaxID=933084 RepID=A0A067Q560_9AGAM|nr:hypothetical protein JAAARDRAFT_69819 [Jaapia argillacea MUCL 33604]
MEETLRAREGSDVFGGGTFGESVNSFNSSTSLRNNAAAPGTTEVSTSDPSANPANAGGEVGSNEETENTGQQPLGGVDAAQPPTPKQPLYKRRWFIITNVVLSLLGIALLFIVLYPVVAAIAQHVVNVSVLNVNEAAILQPQNTTFQLALIGVVTHTGIFNAKIWFTEPVNVTWIDGTTETPLGQMNLDMLTAKSKRAYVNQTTTFNISDEDAFGRFAAAMITRQNFTWRLESYNLKVQALKFPVSHGITFRKDLTLPGINNFDGNVVLRDLSLPSDNPQGGINYAATTGLHNPSPFALGLGTVVFDLSYKNVYIGTGTGYNTQLTPGDNNITLSGVLVPHTDPSELAVVSELFSNYLNGVASPVIATGKSTLQSDNIAISWLSQGLQSLQLTVPFKSLSGAIAPIKSISIGDMSLAFTPQTAWSPLTYSRSVEAVMELPFGFGVSIGEIQNSFNISKNGSTVAGLSTPLGASTSSIAVVNSTLTRGTINITIDNTNMECPTESHPHFSQFNTDLTDLEYSSFRLVGYAKAVANMSIGQLTLDPINFNVSSGLWGLKGLQNSTVITAVDVVGGTTEAIILAINVSIYNPSSLNLNTGDLTLQLYRGGGLLGTTLLPNLTLNMGNNSLIAQGNFEANGSPEGAETLNDFVGGTDVPLKIVGYTGSTQVNSLLQAFETLNIGTTLPGLTTNLLSSASLTVLPTTGWVNNLTHVTVNMANPFTAGLEITQITSTVKSHGVTLGTISSSTNFSATGKLITTSPALNLALDLDPSTIFSVTRALAVDAGLDTAQLDGIVELGGYHYITTYPESNTTGHRRANIYTNFSLPTFVDAAFKQLRSDVELTVAVTIGEYQTHLQYNQTAVPTNTDDTLNLLLPYLAQPIVQKVVDASVLGISTVLIIDPTENSFGTQLQASITNAGPFDAIIHFGSGLTITWNGSPLGTIALPDVQIVGDVGAQMNVTATFQVSDVQHLTDFTKVLLTEESFDWYMSGDNLTVSALGIDVPGINLTSKKVTLKGFNGLKGGVTIQSFDLPSNDPAGGIHLTVNSSVTNPSQVGVQLSSIGFEAFFDNTDLGPVSATSEFTLAPQSSSPLALTGRLLPQTTPSGLQDVSTIFNNFIHGKDSNITIQGQSAGPSDVTWLNEGIKSLQVATFLPNQGPLSIIKSITLNQMELLFTSDTAYDPSSGSNSTDAAFQLPFAFPVDITALEQNITVGYDGQSFAELVIPKGPATTDVQQRIIHLTFNDIPFAVFGDKNDVFDQFVASTTVSQTQEMHLSGTANTDASTAVGLLSLSGIAFSVDTSLAGLQGLNTRTTVVESLDVYHGYPDYLLIKTTASLFNPRFGAALAAGQRLLENYLQGVDSDTAIVGTTDATPISSLKLALSEIHLSPVDIPALHQNLITSAALTFPPNIVQTGIASTSFTLSNPFTASINLLEVTAVATYRDITLGLIDHVDESASPIHATGHSNITSPTLPFKFNLDPTSIIKLLSDRAQEKGVNMGPLPELFQIVLNSPNLGVQINATIDPNPPTCVSGSQFDIDTAILDALDGLLVDLAVDSAVKIDDYATNLVFNQSNVPAITDKTALYLIPAVADPITQSLVNNALLTFSEANITNPSNDGFDLSLQGSLTNIGPLDALITFTEPVSVVWNGEQIATIELPPVCGAANTGVPNYQTNGHLTITDISRFTDFATYLLHNPSFEWTISTEKLRVTALGIIFDNVSLSKTVTFKAFDNLPGVTISNFQLPSDDPSGGIHIETDSIIPSPAQLGIDLGTVGFQAYFGETLIGPLSANNLFLAPNAATTTHLSGRIIPQSGSNLENIGILFSHFLAGDNQTLSVKGQSVQPSGSSGPVTWLSDAFQTLTLAVTLPGQKYTIIQSIAMSDLAVVMTEDDETWSPLASSNFTLAKYKNPFGFSLQVISAAEDIILSTGNTSVAELKLPESVTNGPASTGNVVDLDIIFHNQPLQSLNNGAFQALFTAVTDTASASFDLTGTADVVARTSIGDIAISGIPFDVPSSLGGINSFGGSATLSNVSITGSGGSGGSEYIKTPLTTTLHNPSNVSLETIDIALPVYYNGVMLGRAAINPFNLVPGDNVVPTEFHYEPANANDTVAQGFLSSFLQTSDNLPLTIKGDSSSTPFASLQPALSGLSLTTSLNGLNVPPIITHINVFLGVSTLTDNMVSINFDIHNPLDAPLVIEFVQADSGVNGETYAHFDQPFGSFVIQPGQTTNSGTFGNVLLVQGAIASLAIIPLQRLDVFAVSTTRVGEGGYQIPWLHLTQLNVPTTYSIDGGLDGLLGAAQSMAAHNSSTVSTNQTSTGISIPGTGNLTLPSLTVPSVSLPSLSVPSLSVPAISVVQTEISSIEAGASQAAASKVPQVSISPPAVPIPTAKNATVRKRFP